MSGAMPIFSRLCRYAALAIVISASASPLSASLSQEDRLSPLAAGYVERARIMLEQGNYAGVIDQIKHLDTQNINLPAQQRRDCAYLMALALYQRGDANCVEVLRDFAETYPASPQALPARLAAADYFFFAHHFSNALAAYLDIDFSRIPPADRPLYEYRKALSMTRSGLYDEAAPILSELRDNRHFNLAADYYLAYIDYVKGDYKAAYDGFASVSSRITGANPEGIEPEYYMVQMDYARGRFDDVIKAGNTLIQRHPIAELLPEMERIVGLSYFKTGNYSEAARLLERYLSHDDISPSPDAIYALGVIDYDNGRLQQASEKFSRLTDLGNELAQSTCLYLGQIALTENDATGAAIYFEKASKMNWDPDVTEAALFNYLAARTHGGNIPFSSSIPLLSDFLSQYPSSKYAPQVEKYLATAYYNEKDYARALESIRRIPRPNAEDLEVKQKILYELGMEAMANNRPAKAREYLAEAAGISGDPAVRAQAGLWLGDACYALGRYGDAQEAYQTYLRSDPCGDNTTLARYNLGYALLMQDKYDAAGEAFAGALKADPMLPEKMQFDALIRLADTQYYTGKYQIAEKNYTTAIENNSPDADYAWFRRAVMIGLAGDNDRKISELSAMSSKFPGSKWLPNALLEKGQTFAALGNTDKAVGAFEELRKSHNNSGEARKGMLSLAISYMKEGEERKGETTYREIISTWPTSEEAVMANDDLRRYYSSHGGLQEYAAFLKGVPNAPQIDPSEMEKLAFEGAETAFSENGANLTLLEQYIADYPNGRYLSRALLDIASGKYETDKPDDALSALNRLLEARSNSPEAADALLLKGEILERKGISFRREAAEVYRRLEQQGGNDYLAEAFAGIMRTTDNDEERVKYARLVKNSGRLSADMVEEAEFYEASALLESADKDSAISMLSSLASNPKSLSGAKAAVTLGQYYLDNNRPDEAEKILSGFTDAGSPHEYWLARGFIALADVYHTRGKDYLAVEYLRSLQDNYPGKELDIRDMITSRLKKYNKK